MKIQDISLFRQVSALFPALKASPSRFLPLDLKLMVVGADFARANLQETGGRNVRPMEQRR